MLKRFLAAALAFASLASAFALGATTLSTQMLRVDSRTAMAALDVVGSDARLADGDCVLLEEGARSGVFCLETDSIATQVAADTAQCVYVDSTSEPDGGYVRVMDGDQLNVMWCGATGNFNTTAQTGTADTAAIESALAVTNLFNLQGNRRFDTPIFFPAGNYRITEPFDSSQFNTCLIGAASSSSVLIIDHTDGPGIRLRRSYSCVKHLTITASTARNTTGGVDDYGLQLEPDDTVSGASAFTTLDDVVVTSQPSHGIVIVTESVNGTQLDVRSNKGHGIAIDPGGLTSRVNVGAVGWILLDGLRASSNGGHGIAVGSPSVTSSLFTYRIAIRNLDAISNASDAAVRYATEQIYLVGEQVSLTHSGISGSNTTGAVYAAGHGVTVAQNRFLAATKAVHIGQIAAFTTTEVKITDNQVIGPPAPMNPAITMDAGVSGVSVSSIFSANITSLTTTTAPYQSYQFGNDRDWLGITRSRGVYSVSVQIADDAVAQLTMSGAVFGALTLAGNVQAARAALAHVLVNTGAFCLMGWETAAEPTCATGVLTGTTGVDGNLTISPSTTTNIIYVENRTGATRTYVILFMGNGFISAVN